MQQTVEHLNREEPQGAGWWAFGGWPAPVFIVLLAIAVYLHSKYPEMFDGWGTPRNYVFAGVMAWWVVRKGVQVWRERRKKERMTATERLRKVSD